MNTFFLSCRTIVFSILLALGFGNSSTAQVPEWIWHDNKGAAPAENEERFFRKHFNVGAGLEKALLTVAGDDQAVAFLNGRQILVNRTWARPTRAVVTKELAPGENLIAVRARNNSGDAGLIVKLELTYAGDRKEVVITDSTWISGGAEMADWFKPGFASAGWTRPISRGKLGVEPWGDALTPPTALAADKLQLLPGFKAELVRSSEFGEGSWVCMTVDAKGRLIVSPQEGVSNLLRITLTSAGQVERLETIEQPVGSAMGLLHAFDSLYVSGRGPEGLGLYRLTDANGDDHYDKTVLLKKFDGAAGEHGSHALVLGPDKLIYYMHGNFVKVPGDVAPTSPLKNYAEDQLLPRAEDGNGFGVGIKPPGGFVLRTDAEGKKWELIASGLRNSYDFDFNPDGEMFCFDSDMEWDWGTPWYRPTRIYHLVSGGDYGFREGTAKYPAYYPDVLPPAVDIGIGSPTGVKFGTRSKFPAKYRSALFAMDWSYGRIVAVHLTPSGATYSGTFETFVQGKPLNVTDLEFGADGAMYFLIGGRGTQAGLYRVTHTGAGEDSSPGTVAAEAASARELRRSLEKFHGAKDPAAIGFAWPHLNHPDRWIRYAARLAIESQEAATWQLRALEEERTDASLTALLALARSGSPSIQTELLQALQRLAGRDLDEAQSLGAVRVLSLALIRMGRPAPEIVEELTGAVIAHFPGPSAAINRELAQVMIHLEAPGTVAKTLELLQASPTQEEQLHYIFHLRTLKKGWTLDQRRQYFDWLGRARDPMPHPPQLVQWFREVGREYSNGASYPKFIANIRKDAIASLSEPERTGLASVLDAPAAPAPKPAARPMVRDWKLSEIEPILEQVAKGRSFAKGREAFAVAQCAACHKFGNEGGAVGQDLTAIASRYTRKDIFESILDPSKVVSEQYQNMTVTKKNGDDLTGRIVEETAERIALIVNPLTQERVEVRKADIEKRAPSKVSPMPEGLVNVLTRDEILDLLAYLESAGKADHAFFAK